MTFVIILFIAIVLLQIFKPKIAGALGENRVNKVLSNVDGFKVLKDIMIKTETGTTQIDHVLIGWKGVFVIETKNYDGWIFGDEKSKYWTQVIYKNKNKFYNPIRQNYGHVKAVEKAIGDKYKDNLQSIIVFDNRSNLKKLNATTPVIYLKDLKKFIQNYNPISRLTVEEIDWIYNKLSKENITDKQIRKEHIRNIKNKTKV